MEEPKLTIPKKKYGGESVVFSSRVPRDMLRALDGIAASTGRSRNEVLTLCLEFALDHLSMEEKDIKE